MKTNESIYKGISFFGNTLYINLARHDDCFYEFSKDGERVKISSQELWDKINEKMA